MQVSVCMTEVIEEFYFFQVLVGVLGSVFKYREFACLKLQFLNENDPHLHDDLFS